MAVDRIEQLKRDYTNKYVKVDAARPELARFRDVVGQIKTVNMNGRALVEFQDYHLNIGWYDVDLGSLQVVDKPAPKAEKKPEAKAPAAKPAAKAVTAAGEKKLSPLEMARQQGAGGGAKAPAKPAGGKPSVADILAAARGGKAPEAKAETASAPKAKVPAEKPAATAAATGAKGGVDKSKMSVAEMIALAKGGKSPEAAAPAPAKAAPEPVAKAPAAPPKASPASAEPATPAVLDRNSMSIDDKVAYCRTKDNN